LNRALAWLPLPLLALAVLLLAPSLTAQTAPIADSTPLLTAFYPTPAAQEIGWQNLSRWTSRLHQWQKAGVHSGAQLLELLRIRDSATVEGQRQYHYFTLRQFRNTRDARAQAALDSLGVLAGSGPDAAGRVIEAVPGSTLRRWLRNSPPLQPYHFAILEDRRSKPRLSRSEERVSNTLLPATTSWQPELYQRLVDRTSFGTVQDGNQSLDVWRQRNAISSSANRSVRREGYQKLYRQLAEHRDLFAFALIHTVKSQERLARLLGESDAPSYLYRSRSLEPSHVRALLSHVRGQADVYRQYLSARSRFAELSGGYSDVGPWDLTATAGLQPPVFSLDSARSIMRQALAPLGPEYLSQLDSLLDPAAGHIDVSGGAHRAGGGSSVGFPGTPVGVYLEGFEGYYTDLSRLVHESAHAMQSRMIARGGVLPVYASGANYLGESVALLNELLVADYLTQHASNPALRQFYLERFLGKAFEVVLGAQDADLEQTLYDSVSLGRATDPDDLDSLSTRVMAPYSIWPSDTPERRERWIYARLLYEDPFYLVNYLYSGAIALSLFQQYERDHQAFARRYVNFLKRGYVAAPEVLLREKLDIDLGSAALLSQDFQLLGDRLHELQVINEP
jgi:oligoendopeptidase F